MYTPKGQCFPVNRFSVHSWQAMWMRSEASNLQKVHCGGIADLQNADQLGLTPLEAHFAPSRPFWVVWAERGFVQSGSQSAHGNVLQLP